MSDASPPPPNPWLVRFFRLPVAIYRLGLPGYERLFGQRWILVTTTGRRTGRPHAVMLDLVGHDTTPGRYCIQSGWGRSVDWVRNIEAQPLVEAQLGRRRFTARVVDVSGAEGAEWALRFMKARPLQSRLMAKSMLGLELGSDEEVRAWLRDKAVVFGLDPQRKR